MGKHGPFRRTSSATCVGKSIAVFSFYWKVLDFYLFQCLPLFYQVGVVQECKSACFDLFIAAFIYRIERNNSLYVTNLLEV